MTHERLFGRSAELARIDEMLRQASAGNSGMLVLRGAAGSGKSALMDAAIARASPELTVAQTTGVEAEQALAFSALFDICRPLLGHLDALPPHHHDTLSAALGRRAPVPVDSFTCGAATLGLLAAAAVVRPVLVVIDDWQWIDEASARALSFAMRRLSGLGVAVLVGIRDGEPASVDLGRAFDLEVRPLDDDAAAEVVRASSDVAVAKRVVHHLVAAGHGSPLALEQLTASLTPGQLAGTALLPWPLPHLGGPQQLFAARVAELPDDTRAALLVAAASVSGRTDEVARALRAQGLTLEALEGAEKTGILVIAGGRVAFTHPLARAASYADADAPDRRRAHAALAGAIDTADDGEHRLLHLAAATSEPDEAVAAALETAGGPLRARGAFGAAARLLERAAELSPGRGDRHRRLAAAADAAAAGGYLVQARTLAQEPSDAARDPAVRALAVHVACRCELAVGQRRGGIRRLVEEAERAATADPERAARMLIEAVTDRVRATAVGETTTIARRAVALSDGLGHPLETMAEVALGAALILDGSVEEGRRVLGRYEQLVDDVGVLLEARHLLAAVPMVLVWVEALDEGRRLLRLLIDAAEQHSVVTILPQAFMNLATIEWAFGDWQRVEQLLDEGVALAQQTAQDALVPGALAMLALTQGCQGRAEEAQRNVARALALVGDAPAVGLRRTARAALASLGLGGGRPLDAITALEPELRLPPAANPAPSLWEADLADAYALAGRRADAEALLADFEARVERSGNDRVRAALLRSRGLLADRDAIDDLFGEAAALLDDPPIVYPLARVLFYWGCRLAEAGRHHDAAAKLGEALSLFETLDARSWSEQARTALEGVRSPSLPSTTPAAPPAARVAVAVLGDFSVTVGGQEIVPLRGQPADVVKILAVRGGSLHVDELVEELWPEIDPDTGRPRLRNVLARLRKVAPGLLHRQGEILTLDRGAEVDALEFDRAAQHALALVRAGEEGAAAAVAAAIDRFGGPPLPDSLYQPWAVAARERLQSRLMQLLDVAADLAAASGDAAAFTSALDRAIELDPYDEERYVRAARVLLGLGRRSRALQYLARAREAAAELGVRPSPQVEAVERELRDASG